MSFFMNSPVFTGNPTGPTPLTADNSFSLATTQFVKAQGYGTGNGTVTAIGVTTANGISGSSSGGATPNLTLTLGAITPTTVNGLTIGTTVGALNIANTAGASLATTGGFAINLSATAASTVAMPASTSAIMNYATGAPAQYGLPYAGAASGLISYLAVPGSLSILTGNTGGAPSWAVATGSGSPVMGTSPSISGLSLSGTSAITGGTTTVNSGATLNVASGGSLTIASGATFTTSTTPANAADVVNKGYVDALFQGQAPKGTARVATTQSFTAQTGTIPTYANGASGVGATLTNAGTKAALAIDGVTLSVGDIVLVKNEANATNGLYTVTTVGTGAVNWVLTRHTSLDLSSEFVGAYIVVDSEGTTNDNTFWLCTNATAPTVGTTAITFVQLNGATALTQGTGITISGNTISLTNTSVTVGSTSIALGATSTTLAGLTSVSSTSFTGALTGTASLATALAGGTTNQQPYQTGAGATSFYSASNYGVQVYGATGVPQSIAGATGVLVGSASAIPAFTTAPTGLTINGLTISTTAGTLTIANNAAAVITHAGNFAQTFTATAASSVTMPASTTAVMEFYNSGAAPAQYGISYANTASSGLQTYLAPPTVAGIYVLQSAPAGSAVAPAWSSAATGSGAPVFATSPTLTTPNIGNASAAGLTLNSSTVGIVIPAGAASVTTNALYNVGGALYFNGAAVAGTAANATNLSGGATNQIPYQTGAGTTSFITLANYGVYATGAAGVPSVVAGAAGVLVGSTSAVPSWSTSPILGYTINTTAKTTGYTALATDDIIVCDATSGPFTVLLPAAPSTGMNFVIKKIDSSTNAVTIGGNGKTIDGGSNASVPAQWNSISVVYNGTVWYII